MKVVWSPLARDQVVALIAAERPPAALRWFEEVLHKATALESFPDMGRMVPELRRSSVREVLVVPYRLIYRRDKAQVVILALRHCRRGRTSLSKFAQCRSLPIRSISGMFFRYKLREQYDTGEA